MATRSRKREEQSRYWLSYDLGLRGNYDVLYAWLDEKSAVECGDSIATFQSSLSTAQIRDELAAVLGEPTKARIYIITRDRGGKFLFGKRKSAPWAGYFQDAVESALDA